MQAITFAKGNEQHLKLSDIIAIQHLFNPLTVFILLTADITIRITFTGHTDYIRGNNAEF